MKRIGIVLDKNLDRGACGNVAAILMGQIAISSEVYETNPLNDRDGVQHAAIRYSTVLLKAGRGQLLNLVHHIQKEDGLHCVVFSQTGQGLHNAFPEYHQRVTTSTTEDLVPVGVAVAGDDPVVRSITKKFSLLR